MKIQKIPLSLCISLMLITASALVSYSIAFPHRRRVQLIANGHCSARRIGRLVKLSIMDSPNGNMDSWAKVKIPFYIDFDEIEQHSFTFKILNLKRGRMASPYMVIELDTNRDGTADMWVVQWTTRVYRNCWQTYSVDDWHTSPRTDPHKTLHELQQSIDGKVLCIKVAIGNWENTESHVVLIRSVMINNIELLPKFH